MTIKDVGYEKKREEEEIKDAYPKKVCHMLKRHVKKNKKIIKMHTQRRYATCHGMSKKREEKDSPHPRKIKKREGSCKGVHPPKKSHTLAHLDQIV